MYEWFWDYSDTLIPVLSILAYLSVKKLHMQEWLLLVYSFVCFFIFGLSNYLADRSINNMFLYHVFSLFELLTVMFYSFSLFSSTRIRSVLTTAIIFYLTYWCLNIGLWEPLADFNSNSASIALLLIIVVCGLFFLSLNDKKELLYFQKLPQFRVVHRNWFGQSIGNTYLFFLIVSSKQPQEISSSAGASNDSNPV